MCGRRQFIVGLLVLAACCFGNAVPVQGQATSSDVSPNKVVPQPNEISTEQIQARLKKAEESKDLPEAVRLTLVETYKKILLQLKASDESSTRSTTFLKATHDAPNQLKQAKAELELPTDANAPVDENQPLAKMQQSLTQAEARLAELQKSLADLQADPKHRADRRVEIPKLQEAARKQLADVELLRAVKPPADENAEVTEANRLLHDARKRAADVELNSLEQELRFYEASVELQTARRDLAVVQVAQADQSVKAWRNAVNDRRRAETEQQAREARMTALHAHPAIKQLAKESADLTVVRQALADKIERATRDSDAVEKRLVDLDAEFAKVVDRVKRVGLTQAIGVLLRKQRESLRNIDAHHEDLEKRQAEISKTSLELVDLEDQRSPLADIDARTEFLIKELGDSVNSTERPLVQADIRQLLQTKRGYLDSLIADTNSYLDKLVEFDTRDRQLIRKAKDYATFCDEYILWIHSTDIVQSSDLPLLVQSLKWLTNLSEWKSVGVVLATDAASHPLTYILGVIVLLSLLFSQRTWKRMLRETGVEASKSFSTSFRPTALALVLTALNSITWPALLFVVGHRLSQLAGNSEFLNAVGRSTKILALLLLTLEFSRRVCAGGGLGEAHFGWLKDTQRKLRHVLRLLLVLGLPTAFVVLMVESQSSENAKRSLGRAGFLIGQALLIFSAHQVWMTMQAIALERSKRDTWLWSTNVRRIWYVTTVGAPVFLALLSILGYYYTAMQLELRLIATFWLMLSLTIVHATLMRGLLMAYRDLAVRRARERRANEAVTATAAVAMPGAESAIVPEATFRLSDINEQTRKLVRMAVIVALFTGMCLIWVEVLPALRVLRRVELWPHPFNILDTIATITPVPGTLTLSDAIIAALVALVTFAAARNISGLLELTVLRQLTLDSGVRYAVTAISRYVITVLGIIFTFGQLGIAWSHIQWLIAAVSVGLGFGLQEIFANFVSGLILLFERPIRIGDVVSIGDVTGKVTRIRMRATTITDWDLRELIVPNKELITARVMNWTLTATTARMTIKVGVVYGTDPDLAKRLMLEVANKNTAVLKDPPPHALFDDFGDSTLNFTLRVYLPSLDVFLQTRHELLTGIHAAFKKAGVELAFPTRDIHIRSSIEPVPREIAATSVQPPRS